MNKRKAIYKKIPILVLLSFLLQGEVSNVYAIGSKSEEKNIVFSNNEDIDKNSDMEEETVTSNGVNLITRYKNIEDDEYKLVYWTKGVNPPKISGVNSDFKREVTLSNDGNSSYVDYKSAPILGNGWFDVNKSESKVIDKNLCFATAASNALTWWLDQNSDNIDKFLIKNPDYKKAEELKAINYYNGQYDSGVYKHLLKQYAWRETGYWSDILYDHFINGYKPKKGGGTNTSIEDAEKLLKEGPEIVNGGFFYDVFGTNLLSTRRGYGWDYAGLGPWLKENILAGNSILLDYYVGRQSHMITVWGVEFNENGKLTGVFISDSDDQKQYGMMRYRIVEHHGAPFLTTNTRGPGSVRVDSITTLSLGQKYWDEYFGESKQVEKVTLNKTELNLETGKEETLKATITPETTPNKEVVWSSDNEKVATVNQNGKVVAVGQGNATITVTTKDGNKTSTCTVRVKRKIVNPPINSDGSNGEIVTPPQVQIEFIDTKGHWAENTIKLFIDKGYINGYDDKTFKPNNSITRAEFVKVVNKLFGYIEKGTEKFYDVNENDWFYNDICIGIKAGYIKGKSETIFSPNDKITRQEVAMILTNIMNNKDENLDKLNSFKDGNETPQWAQSSVEGAIEAGYLNGYEDNTIKAFGNTTRAEAVTMLSRVKK